MPQVLHTFSSKRGERMAYPDPLVWLQSNRDLPSSESDFCLMVKKNHIAADMIEPIVE